MENGKQKMENVSGTFHSFFFNGFYTWAKQQSWMVII